MKRILILAAVAFGLSLTAVNAQERFVTLAVNSSNKVAEVSIGTNETAEVKTLLPNEDAFDPQVEIIKDGVSVKFSGNTFTSSGSAEIRPVHIAGPATIRLGRPESSTAGFCTIKISPESFPPGQTIILPEGTVGVVRVESSTNLISWQTEWSQTFSNTNQNRFFRLRAERSLP